MACDVRHYSSQVRRLSTGSGPDRARIGSEMPPIRSWSVRARPCDGPELPRSSWTSLYY